MSLLVSKNNTNFFICAQKHKKHKVGLVCEMGSPCSSAAHIADINYRERTCNNLPKDELGRLKARDLAAEGFYNVLETNSVQCFSCGLPILPHEFDSVQQVRVYHARKTPTCSEAQKHLCSSGGSSMSSGGPAMAHTLNGSLKPSQMAAATTSAGPSSSSLECANVPSSRAVLKSQGRFVECKGFHSFDSLRYERERLATFIDWPVAWLSPETLAKEGFYYLRDNDYCSCVFCRGIVGAWEPGDVPSQEHQRHFPKCPFVRGHPVGNVPLAQGDLLASLPAEGPVIVGGKNGDLTGANQCDCKRILLPLPVKEKPSPPQSPKHSNPCPNALCGLPEYTGPKRKEFSTLDSRIRSFKNWPKGVKQQPVELAQAGFFYCGLSDHVRCYHCGQGLRNWEAADEPWVEHARWYPKCHFVLLSKGVEFIDQVRRENPPYYVTDSSKVSSERGSGSGLRGASVGAATPYVSHSYTADIQSNYRVRVTDSQLSVLMELDIQKAVLEMGFKLPAVRKALRQKIEETGVPFFNLETCIERVLACSEENGSADDEAQRQQEAKMAAYQREREDRIHQSHEESLLRESNMSPATTAASATALSQPSSGEDVVNTQRLESSASSLAPASSSSPSRGSRTPIITSPVMPPRRFQVTSDTPPAVTSTTQEASIPVPLASSIVNTSGTDESLNSSTELATSENDFDGQEPMDSEDIIEYPRSSSEENSSYSSNAGLNDNAPVNETFNDTSTPRASPTPRESYDDHFGPAFIGSSPDDLTVTPLLIVSSASPALSSSPTFSMPGSTSFSSSSSSSSTVSATADPISLEMLRQVDRVITHAEATQKRVCRNLSSCSTISIASCKSSVGSLDGGDHVAAMETSSSSDGEATLTVEEQLTEAEKKVHSLRNQVDRLREMRMCKICMDAELSVVLLPCAHMATCSDCTLALSTCPICRSVIRHVIRPNVVA
ncbi:BIR repeat [Trinorchestia longiramus]|nr:BIR repeat [Trinorchestia longiramus]